MNRLSQHVDIIHADDIAIIVVIVVAIGSALGIPDLPSPLFP